MEEQKHQVSFTYQGEKVSVTISSTCENALSNFLKEFSDNFKYTKKQNG